MPVSQWIAVVLMLACAAAGAQNYPSRPIRLVVPAPPGGGTDMLGRMVAHKLTDTLRQPFIIDNRGGASGMIGSEIVARADADGHTLLICFTTHVTNPSLYPKMPYDTVRDFAPVAMVGVIPSVLALHPSIPSQSVKEFIAYAKERPGKLVYGSAGSGSATHLSTVLFNAMTGISMVHVPYKGSAPALTDLLAGQLNLMFGNMASAMPHVKERQTARAGGHQCQTSGGCARVAYYRRKRFAGLRSHGVVRVVRAGAHACGHRAQAQ